MFLLTMATKQNYLFLHAILVFVLLPLNFTDAQIGVAYGRNGDGLPPPSEVVNIFKRNGINRMRIYDPFPETLEALRDSGIELTVGAPNDQLQSLSDRPNADAWVRDNIQKYHPSVSFKHVVVGNEVSPIRNQELVGFIVPAMRNIYDALVAVGISDVSVTTAVETELIDPATNYPPSKGEFRADVKDYMRSVLEFLVETNSPLFVNIYPYFAYVYGGGAVPLNYALLQPDGGQDTPDGRYDNLYYALLDTMYAAIEKSGVASVSDQSVTNTQVKGSESGWPSGGGTPQPAFANQAGSVPNEVKGSEGGWPRGGTPPPVFADQAGSVANPENAQTYINNLIRVTKSGTPRRPDRPIETYIFAMFDENKKPGPEIEKNFGIFQTDGQTKFPINFN